MEKEENRGVLPDIRKYIGLPNPIFNKTVDNDTILITQSQQIHPEDVDSSEEEVPDNQIYTLATAYSEKRMTFVKWRNRNMLRDKVSFYASHFYQRADKDKLVYEGQLFEDNLIFDSGFETANLLAVFKMGENKYDLVMQNDTNSGGYTQWFNFKVSNGKWRGTVTFNIVNFVKNI